MITTFQQEAVGLVHIKAVLATCIGVEYSQ